jgi:hypothetical protein
VQYTENLIKQKIYKNRPSSQTTVVYINAAEKKLQLFVKKVFFFNF